MKAVSFFSGIGGFDLGFESAGIQVTHQIEKDKRCVDVLKRHFPGVIQLGDVENAEIPNADVFFGGFPCQDVSMAGRRKGLAGSRSGLWFSYLQAIERTKPSIVVIENVTGLLSSNNGNDFATVINGLSQCGYSVCWRVLDAQYFGVPQRRRRVFIIGSLRNGRCAEVLFEQDGISGDSTTMPRRSQDRNRGGNAPYSIQMNYSGEASRMDISPTITTVNGDNLKLFVCDKQGLVRRFTPTEIERLLGFPEGWTAGQSDAARYRQLGNAVAVPVAEWIGLRIVNSEE